MVRTGCNRWTREDSGHSASDVSVESCAWRDGVTGYSADSSRSVGGGKSGGGSWSRGYLELG